MVRLADCEPEITGDREFRVLLSEGLTITQFAGMIPPGRAPAHHHSYDEVVHVLAGQGVVHLVTAPMTPIGPGTSIYLPPLAPHCLENTGPEPLRVLGVFHPAGSPGGQAGLKAPAVLAIVLALAAAIGYGGSDFAAGLASRSAPVIQITLLASAVSAVIVAAALPFAASPGPSAAALAWGFVAGLGGTLGAFALYLGFRHAAFSVAAPLSAVASAGFSVLAGLLYGERPTTLALTGIVLALPAIVGVSASAGGEEAEADWGGLTRGPTRGGGRAGGRVYGLVAGAFFALLFIGLDRAGSGSGLWPVAAAAAGEVAAALVAAVGRAQLPAVRRPGAAARGDHRGGRGGRHHLVLLRHPPRLPGHHRGAHLALPRGDDRAGPDHAGRAADRAAAGRAGLAGVCVSLIAVGGR